MCCESIEKEAAINLRSMGSVENVAFATADLKSIGKVAESSVPSLTLRGGVAPGRETQRNILEWVMRVSVIPFSFPPCPSFLATPHSKNNYSDPEKLVRRRTRSTSDGLMR